MRASSADPQNPPGAQAAQAAATAAGQAASRLDLSPFAGNGPQKSLLSGSASCCSPYAPLTLLASLGFQPARMMERVSAPIVATTATLFRAGPICGRRSSPDHRPRACPIQSQNTPVQGATPPDGAFHPLAATVSSPASSQHLQGLPPAAPRAKRAMDAGMTGPTQHQSFSQVFR